MNERTWPSEWMRGVLGLSVLSVVTQAGEAGTYGYAIAQQLQESGLGVVKGGTLYPLLNRLAEDGYLTSDWTGGEGGPGRKTFVVTDNGRCHLNDRLTQWQSFTDCANAVMTKGLA